jgi:hypothetical protein
MLLSFLLASACVGNQLEGEAPKLTPARLAGQVMAAERAWLTAYEEANAAAMSVILAEEFIITFPDGRRQRRAEVLARLASAGSRGPVRYMTQGTEVHGSGSVVVLTGIVMTERGARVSRESYTDTWVWRGGRWQVLSSHLSNAPPS